MLTGKTVVLAVTGSIAAYKIANLARMLKKLHADVQVLMTQNATNFINPITLETLTNQKCLIDTFDRNFQYSVEHVALAKRADVVLVAPEIPQNTGNVARTCACTACRLHLVGPMGFAIDDKKLKHAGLDYWHYLDITYYDGLADFFARNNGPYYYFTTKAPQRYTDVQYPDGAYLVFGREDAGLPEALLVENQEHCIRMPMRDPCRSLNLSNSVAVGVYEVLRQWDFPELLDHGHLRDYEWK